MKCTVCGEETNLDEAILLADKYYCKICQELPIQSPKLCMMCKKPMVNPHNARKRCKECSKESTRRSTLRSLKKLNKEKKEAWKALPEESKWELINKRAMELLHKEEVGTFININDLE